jgi:NAD(P)-dependent dehydrogenase (short-subunit alcohol dehydrogenase family)
MRSLCWSASLGGLPVRTMPYHPITADLTGRIALVTGANSGMGKETARELTRMGATVVLGCRSARRGEAAARDIVGTTGRDVVSVLTVDLSSPGSVRTFVEAFGERFSTLDILVNNAAASLRRREVTPEGFERHWATNVLGPHLLTTLLLPQLERSGNGRIVNVSTIAAGGLNLSDTQYERRPFKGVTAYRASKQAARMLTWALAERLGAAPVTVNALNPGYVVTDLTRNVGGLLKLVVSLTSFAAKSPLEGADTAIWLAASPDVRGWTGRFWNKRKEVQCKFRDPTAITALWNLVEDQLTASLPMTGAGGIRHAGARP